MYATAQFKFDIRMHVLLQSLEKFVRKLANFSRADDLWNTLSQVLYIAGPSAYT